MPLSKRMMAVGLPGASALAVNGSVRIYASGVSTTSGAPNATPLTDDINFVSQSGTLYVSLPADATIGDTITISNFSGNNLTYYPTPFTTTGYVNVTGLNQASAVLATNGTVQLSIVGYVNGGPNWVIT